MTTMNVNSISFGNQDFNSLIAQPPASSSMAAANMYYDEPDTFESSSSSFGKKAAIALGATVAVAATLALLRGKVGAFKDIDLSSGIKNQDGFMGKVKYGVAKAGQTVIDGCQHVRAVWSKEVKKDLLEKKKDKLTREITEQENVVTSLDKKLSEAAEDAKAGIQKEIDDAKEILKNKKNKLDDVDKELEEVYQKLGNAKPEEPKSPTEEGSSKPADNTPPTTDVTTTQNPPPSDTPAA